MSSDPVDPADPAPVARQRVDNDHEESDVDGFMEDFEEPSKETVRRALMAADEMGNLQAHYRALQEEYINMKRTHLQSQSHVEESYEKFRRMEMLKTSSETNLKRAEAENKRLQAENGQLSEALKATENLQFTMEGWREKYKLCTDALYERRLKHEATEEKYAQVVAMVKTAMSAKNELEKKSNSLQAKLDLKNMEIRAVKKHWNVIVRLVADISHQISDDLPPALRERVDKLPLDELLQIAKPGKGGDSDDEDAEAVQRLLNADSGGSLTPRKGGRAPRGRGSRGGRGGRGHGGGGGEVVDESIHEDLLARKLHRDDADAAPTAPSEPAAKSVMGKKTTTVREQQERMKEGMKEKIAEMKKEQAKDAVEPAVIVDEAEARRAMLQQDLMLSDDDEEDDFEKGEGEETKKEEEQKKPPEGLIDFPLPDHFDVADYRGVPPAEDEEPTEEDYMNSFVFPPMADQLEMEGEDSNDSQPDEKEEAVPREEMSPERDEGTLEPRQDAGMLDGGKDDEETMLPPAATAVKTGRVIEEAATSPEASQEGGEEDDFLSCLNDRGEKEEKAITAPAAAAVKTAGVTEEAAPSLGPFAFSFNEAPATSKIAQKKQKHDEVAESGGEFKVPEMPSKRDETALEPRQDAGMLDEVKDDEKASMPSDVLAVKTGGTIGEATTAPAESPSKEAPSTSRMTKKPKDSNALAQLQNQSGKSVVSDDEGDEDTTQWSQKLLRSPVMKAPRLREKEETASEDGGASSSKGIQRSPTTARRLREREETPMPPRLRQKKEETASEDGGSSWSKEEGGTEEEDHFVSPIGCRTRRSIQAKTPQKDVPSTSKTSATPSKAASTTPKKVVVTKTPKKTAVSKTPKKAAAAPKSPAKAATKTPRKAAASKSPAKTAATKTPAKAAAKTPRKAAAPSKSPAKAATKTPAKAVRGRGRPSKASLAAEAAAAAEETAEEEEEKTETDEPAAGSRTPVKAGAKTPTKAAAKTPKKPAAATAKTPAKAAAVAKTPRKAAAPPKTPAKKAATTRTPSKKRVEQEDSGSSDEDEEEKLPTRATRSSGRLSGVPPSWEHLRIFSSSRSASSVGATPAIRSSSSMTAAASTSSESNLYTTTSYNTRRIADRRKSLVPPPVSLPSDDDDEDEMPNLEKAEDGEADEATPQSSPAKKKMRRQRRDSDDPLGDAQPSTSKA